MSAKSINAILLIEDNRGDARLLMEMLTEQGVRGAGLAHVETMREAEAHLARNSIDVILLDVGLPDANGLGAVRRAKSAAPRTPLVVLTGMDDEALASQALQEGAQDYLIKGEIEGRGLLRALRYAIERETLEESLFVEKERAQVTLNCIGDAVACTDISGNLTFLNIVAEELTGWSYQEATGRPMAEIFQIVDAAHRKAIPNPMKAAIARDRTGHLPADAILIRRDGLQIPIEDSVAPIHDREGHATGAVIVLRDVSAARAMAAQMADSASDLARQNTLLSKVNGELSTLVRSSPIAIYATDPEGIVTMWSPAAERLTGFSHEEAVGSFLPIVPEAAVGDARDRIRRVCLGEPATNVVLAWRKKDGAMIELSISMGPLNDESGVARGVISLAENMTEASSERRRIERMQSEFVSTVSHELRTPLTSIGGSLGLIVGGAAGVINDRAARLIEIANNNTQRLIRLVNDILDIETLQSERMAFHFAPVRLDDVIDQAIAANLAYASSFEIEIRRSGTDTDVVIRADPDRVNQALTNLISNAVKFSPSRTHVEIVAKRSAQSVRVTVGDHGAGIPAEFRARIFGRFAQADSSDMRQKGGSGLGLSIVRQIMERHGGSVSFNSDPEEGTRFHLDFPAPAELQRQHTFPPLAHAGRMLVCTRDSTISDPIRACLLAHGFEGALAPSVDDAAMQAGEIVAAVIGFPLGHQSLGDLIRVLRTSPGSEGLPILLLCAERTTRNQFYVPQALPLMAWMARLAEVKRLHRASNDVQPLRWETRRAILHVESDLKVVAAVDEALARQFRIVSATTLDAARESLVDGRFDFVIMDLHQSVHLVKHVIPKNFNAPTHQMPIVILAVCQERPEPMSSTRKMHVDASGKATMIVEAVQSAIAPVQRRNDNQEARRETQGALR
jgi:PAS domain S-box-containing protein